MRTKDTPELLRGVALRLFAERGYAAVTVAQIAEAAGVSHMTFFRHFPTKESVVVADLFDPVIAAAVSAQPPGAPPLSRAVRGLLAAVDGEAGRAELASPEFALRIGLVASTPALRGAVWAASRATEDAIAAALAGPGVAPPTARAAAAAVMGAATALLLDWAGHPGDADAGVVLRCGLSSLVTSEDA